MKASKDILRQLPALDELMHQYEREGADGVFGRAYQAETEARDSGARGAETAAVPAVQQPTDEMRRRVIEAGRRAIVKLHEGGDDAELEAEEVVGLEAIVAIEGRPFSFKMAPSRRLRIRWRIRKRIDIV